MNNLIAGGQKMAKTIKGEKYIYLLMGYMLAMQNNGVAQIGKDNGIVGGQNYYRLFKVYEYMGSVYLAETKNGANFADYTRHFQIIANENRVTIKEALNEAGENMSERWTH